MIRIKCPYCGERDHSEFTYGGDGSIVYPPLDASVDEWTKAIFFRENIYGMQTETWHHSNGCRLWLKVRRSTISHEIHSVEPAQENLVNVLKKENK